MSDREGWGVGATSVRGTVESIGGDRKDAWVVGRDLGESLLKYLMLLLEDG